MKPPKADTRQHVSGMDAALHRVRTLGAVFLTLIVFSSAFYLHLAWVHYANSEVDNALSMGETVLSLLHPTYLGEIVGMPQGVTEAPYLLTKHSLIRFVTANASVAQVYLASMKEGDVVFLLDSSTEAAMGNAAPGAIYTLEKPFIRKVFATKSSVYTDQITNRWGAWVSTLSPVISETTGVVIAVLGITYPATNWSGDIFKRMVPDFVVIFCFILLSIALFRITLEHVRLRERSRVVSMDEALFHHVFEQAPIGISIGSDERITYKAPDERYSVNCMFEQILGRSRQELENTDWRTITHPDDLPKDLEQLARFHRDEIDRYTIEKRFLRPDGTPVWTSMTIGSLVDTPSESPMHLCILEDITARKQMEEALRESERSKAVLLSHLPGLAYRCRFDHDWTMEFVSEGCETLTGYPPESLLHNRDLSYNDLIAPEYRELLWNEWQQTRLMHRNFRYEYEIVTRAAGRKWVLELAQCIYNADGSVEALEGIVIDISELKMREAQVNYMNEHDFLTSLYNRIRFDREKKRMETEKCEPLSIAICDINGVRLVNDAFSPAEGDRLIVDVAYILQSFCRTGDVLSRTGGDEFTLLLPQTTEEETIVLIDKISRAVERYNQTDQSRPYEVSLSFGFSTVQGGEKLIDQCLIEAEEHLSHRKLLNQKSSHNAMLASIMATLYARSQETEEHGKRLTNLTRMIGVAMNLDPKTMDELVLLSMLHDIGKVGIDDRILNKPGRLNPEEWEQMKKHSEIGCRIALSTPELEHTANYILCHHERWDGGGYPAGLAGEAVPLPSRILNVADAYDAMTENRVYHQAIPREEALLEIERCAGGQFDPSIAVIFTQLMRRQGIETGSEAGVPVS